MIYDVEFSLDAAAELLRIAEVVGSAVFVLQAAEANKGVTSKQRCPVLAQKAVEIAIYSG